MELTFATLKQITKLLDGLIFGEIDSIKIKSEDKQRYLDYLKIPLEQYLFIGFELREGVVDRVHDCVKYRLFWYGKDEGTIRLRRFPEKIGLYLEKFGSEIYLPLI